MEIPKICVGCRREIIGIPVMVKPKGRKERFYCLACTQDNTPEATDFSGEPEDVKGQILANAAALAEREADKCSAY